MGRRLLQRLALFVGYTSPGVRRARGGFVYAGVYADGHNDRQTASLRACLICAKLLIGC
jgi:hypothetical protein